MSSTDRSATRFTFTIQVPDRTQCTFGYLQQVIELTLGTPEGVRPDDAVRGLLRRYQPGVRTRALEVDADDARLTVRILTCSSPEDHGLAIGIGTCWQTRCPAMHASSTNATFSWSPLPRSAGRS